MTEGKVERMKGGGGGIRLSRYEALLHGSGLKTKDIDSLAPLLLIMLHSYRNNELHSLQLSSMAITQINSPVPQLETATTTG